MEKHGNYTVYIIWFNGLSKEIIYLIPWYKFFSIKDNLTVNGKSILEIIFMVRIFELYIRIVTFEIINQISKEIYGEIVQYFLDIKRKIVWKKKR